jgi:crotonobetainyl-CoA:carnitine CoA-transferase CaiB-like acyl-CoA transferase
LLIAAPSQRLWEAVVAAIDAPELALDPRFATVAERSAHREALAMEINTRLATDDSEGWLARFQRAGVPVSRVHGLEESVASPVAQERSTFIESDGVPLVRLPWLFDGQPVRWRSTAPRLGEHTLEILDELGIDGEYRKQVLEQGAALALEIN